jgi:hypothetical protein
MAIGRRRAPTEVRLSSEVEKLLIIRQEKMKKFADPTGSSLQDVSKSEFARRNFFSSPASLD